ncbi:MAG: hypothetical protein RMJ19_06095 [Gemmatales bacterium]|nr:hypothetical protein [Gemmatales bacterium]MDW8175224.1 hypothetical protein [Gemmatales bacterium]
MKLDETAFRRGISMALLWSWFLGWEFMLGFAGSVWPQPNKVTDLPAQRVTLVGQLTLQEALRQLEELAPDPNNHLADLRAAFGQRADNPKLALELRDVSFWQACDELAQQAGLRVVLLPANAERGVLVGLLTPATRKPLPKPPVCYTGPFRVRIVEVQAWYNLDDPDLSRLELTTEWACEPRYLPLWLHTTPESVRWQGADKTEHAARQAGQGTIKWLGEAALRWRLQLPLPPRQLPSLPFLKLQATALIAPKRLTFQVSPLSAGQTCRSDDVLVTLRSADYDAPNGQWRLQLHLDYPRADGPRGFDLESYHTWIMDASRFWLQAQGQNRRVTPGRPVTVSIEGRHAFQLELVFSAPEQNRPAESPLWALHGIIPATPLAVPIRASFRDIPLP